MNNIPGPQEIRTAFDAVSEPTPVALRKLGTLLYLDPKKWRDVREASTGNTLLLEAVAHGDNQVASLLLKKGFSPLAWNDSLSTGLHLSQNLGIAHNMMRFSQCAMALEQDRNGDLPLHIHLREGRADVVDMLLQAPNASAQVLRKNNAGETALFDAGRHNPEAVLRMLFLGADPRVKNNDGHNVCDVTTDPGALAKVTAYSAQFTRFDEAKKENLAAEIASDAKIQLATRAKQFLNLPAFADEASPETARQEFFSP